MADNAENCEKKEPCTAYMREWLRGSVAPCDKAPPENPSVRSAISYLGGVLTHEKFDETLAFADDEDILAMVPVAHELATERLLRRERPPKEPRNVPVLSTEGLASLRRKVEALELEWLEMVEVVKP
jgi:hypothetical protein